MTATILPLETAARLHARLRDWLLENYQFESDDDQCLNDTLEGLSDFKEILAALAREAKYEEACAEALKGLIKEMQDRKARREAKAERLRDAVAWAMQEAGERKIDAPDLTISLGAGRSKVVPLGEPTPTTCPRFVVKTTTYTWDKKALAEGVTQGDPAAMELANVSNPQPTLTIRTR